MPDMSEFGGRTTDLHAAAACAGGEGVSDTPISAVADSAVNLARLRRLVGRRNSLVVVGGNRGSGDGEAERVTAERAEAERAEAERVIEEMTLFMDEGLIFGGGDGSGGGAGGARPKKAAAADAAAATEAAATEAAATEAAAAAADTDAAAAAAAADVIEAAEADVIEAAEIAPAATVAAELEQGTLEDMDSRHRPEPSDSGSGSISVRGGGGEDEGHSEHQDGDEGSEDAGEWTVLVHGESGRDYWLWDGAVIETIVFHPSF